MSSRRDTSSLFSLNAQIGRAIQSEIARWGLGGQIGFVIKIRWSSEL